MVTWQFHQSKEHKWYFQDRAKLFDRNQGYAGSFEVNWETAKI